MVHLPRIMLAAPASGSGKTTITCGLLQALVERELWPASFKCGPDYIDPMFHTKVIGTKARNLDTFFTDRELTRHLFARTARYAGISILEGVMGIYDGLGGISVRSSSYDLACQTATPVVLVINARGMSLSVIPLIQGYLRYQEQLDGQVIRGVILNQMPHMTYLQLKPLIEAQTGVRLYGYVPRLPDCCIESRHLGLVTPDEISDLQKTLNCLARELEHSLDIDGLIALAHEAEDYDEKELQLPERIRDICKKEQKEKTKIAAAMDEAFCFYYQDNLELLSEMGAEILTFSPLHDTTLPLEIDGLILGGGYPELYAEGLSQNSLLRTQIRERIQDGLPFLAECGGFMYLHDEMEDMEGSFWPMCGVIHGKACRTQKLGRFGYITLERSENANEAQLLGKGQIICGHEFHYFDSTNNGSDYTAKKPSGTRSWDCMHGTSHSAAGFPHLYYWSNPQFASDFLKQTEAYRKKRMGDIANDRE